MPSSQPMKPASRATVFAALPLAGALPASGDSRQILDRLP